MILKKPTKYPAVADSDASVFEDCSTSFLGGDLGGKDDRGNRNLCLY